MKEFQLDDYAWNKSQEMVIKKFLKKLHIYCLDFLGVDIIDGIKEIAGDKFA